MLFSIVLAAIFLYLLLVKTGLPVFYSVFVSLGIAFLSPQIDRFSGHFTLGYVWAIPLLLYLMLLVHTGRHKAIYSLLTGIALFILMTGHVYFFVFFAFMIIIYWVFIVFSIEKKNYKSYLTIAFHLTLQLILPLIVFYLLINQYAEIAPDRPAKPYGFLVYKASPESVFLPVWGIGYGKFLHEIRNFGYVQWEGVSYVGLVSTIGFVIILIGLIKKAGKGYWKSMLQVTNNQFLNIMFWASFIALLYSFGFPFILGLEFLVEYLGPLQQLRSIGRCAWLFYFMINIVVFYNLWHWKRVSYHPYLRVLIMLTGILMLYTDMYLYIKNKQDFLNNRFVTWSDLDNSDPDNDWVNRIDPSQYQAIIPLPAYHMGSDNYGIAPRCEMLGNSFLVAMKTGLPVAAIYMSRASISQSIKNIAMVMEPYRKLDILKDLPNKKPFLIVAGKCNEYTTDESNLLHLGVKIDSSVAINLYRLDYECLMKIQDINSRKVLDEFASNNFSKPDTMYTSDTAAHVSLVTFNDQDATGYQGNALRVSGRSRSLLFDGAIKTGDNKNYSCSCWFSPINLDLFPKSRIEVECIDSLGNRYYYKNLMAGNIIRTVDGSWGLIEINAEIAHSGDRLKIYASNSVIGRKQAYLIDELLIRPDDCNVYVMHDSLISKNNRWYQVLSENKAIMEVPFK
jgi:hypothetical protein